MKIEIDTDWLIQRAEEENLNTHLKGVKALSYAFASTDKREEMMKEMGVSIGKMQMLLEIQQKFTTI